MEYDLTNDERSLVTWLVEANKRGDLEERFLIMWTMPQIMVRGYGGSEPFPEISPNDLDALEAEGLLRCHRSTKTDIKESGPKNKPRFTQKERETSRRCTLTRKAHEAVQNNFVKQETQQPQPNITQHNYFYAEVNQSAIGPNSHVELTHNLDLSGFRERIDSEGGQYRGDLHRLLDRVEAASKNGEPLEPGSLSEFNEAMQNRSWIVSPIVSLILGLITQVPVA